MQTLLCEHAPATIAIPSGNRCEECGSDNRLRMCAACGHVGCCESQAGHARAHALGAEHPVILQVPVGEGWAWCYTENRYL
jgi:monovalent cation/hydrogen antiporter